MPTTASHSKILRERRHELGLTQMQTANLVGLSTPSVVSHYEHGLMGSYLQDRRYVEAFDLGPEILALLRIEAFIHRAGRDGVTREDAVKHVRAAVELLDA